MEGANPIDHQEIASPPQTKKRKTGRERERERERGNFCYAGAGNKELVHAHQVL